MRDLLLFVLLTMAVAVGALLVAALIFDAMEPAQGAPFPTPSPQIPPAVQEVQAP